MMGLASVALTLAALAAPAQAGIIFAGSTLGQFDAPLAPALPNPQATSVLGGLTFTGASFSVEEAFGFAAIGSVGTTQNLGTMSLTTASYNYNNHRFLLQLDLTLPLTITSGNDPTNFTANIYGGVQSTMGGGSIVFFDASESYTFNNPQIGSGEFSLFIDNVNITPGLSAPITGRIFVSNFVPAPEASSLALLGLGAMGLLRRRR